MQEDLESLWMRMVDAVRDDPRLRERDPSVIQGSFPVLKIKSLASRGGWWARTVGAQELRSIPAKTLATRLVDNYWKAKDFDG
jgi:hypothetical protein